MKLSSETTADTIGLAGGSGAAHDGEACPEEVQVRFAALGDGRVAVGVEAPHAVISKKPREATNAR